MKFQVTFLVLIVTLFVITTEAHERKHQKGHKGKHGLSHLPCEMRNCTAKGKSCVEFRPLCLHNNNTAITRSKCVGTPPEGCEECICVREDGEFSCRKDISELQIPVCNLKPRHNKKCHCRDDDDDDSDDKNDDDYDRYNYDDDSDDKNDDDYSRYNYDGDLGSGDDTNNGKKIKPTRSKGRKPCHKPDPKSRHRPRVSPKQTPRPKSTPRPKRKHGLSHLPCKMRNCTAKGKSCVELRPLCLHNNNTAITRSKCIRTPPEGCEKCICVREDGEFSCRKDISELQIPVCILPSPKPQHNKKCRCRDDDDKNDDDYDTYNYDGDLDSGDDTNNGKKIKPTRSKGHKPCHTSRYRSRVSSKPTPRPKSGPKQSPRPKPSPRSKYPRSKNLKPTPKPDDPKPSTNIKPTPRSKHPKPTSKPPKPGKDPKTKPKKKP